MSETFEWPTVGIALRVDGHEYPVPHVWIGESLLAVLRERLDLDEPRDGCSVGECGACLVELDGVPTAACLVPAVAAVAREIRTPRDPAFAVARAALAEVNANPCGHCGPGLAVAITVLLRRNPDPGDAAVREALAGHLCQCADAGRWVAAVEAAKAAEAGARGGGSELSGGAGAASAEGSDRQPPDPPPGSSNPANPSNPSNLSNPANLSSPPNPPSTVNAQPPNPRSSGARSRDERPARRPPSRPQDPNPRAGR